MAAVADIASTVTGRAITRTVVSDEEYRKSLVGHGTPEPLANLLLGMFLGMRQGEFAAVSPTLEDLLGRPPQTTRDVLTEALTAR